MLMTDSNPRSTTSASSLHLQDLANQVPTVDTIAFLDLQLSDLAGVWGADDHFLESRVSESGYPKPND